MHGVDVVVHAAALKQVPSCEYNPFEAIQTNIIGAKNVIDAAIDQGVKRVIGHQHRQGGQPDQPLRRHQALRREAVRPGQRLRPPAGHDASAWCATATSSAAAAASSRSSPRSARPARVTVTDPGMTRFWITLEQGVELRHPLRRADAGRRDLRAEDPEHAHHGPRRSRSRRAARSRSSASGPARSCTRALISEDESRQALELDDMFVHRAASTPSWAFAGLGGRQAAGRRLPLLERRQRRVAVARPRCRSWRDD